MYVCMYIYILIITELNPQKIFILGGVYLKNILGSLTLAIIPPPCSYFSTIRALHG